MRRKGRTMKRTVFSAVLVLMVSVFGCSGKDAGKAENGGAGKPPVAVETVVAAPVDMVTETALTGSLSPKFETVVRAEIKSRVTDVFVTEWVSVPKGKELMKSDTRDIEQALKSARANLNAAREREAAANAHGDVALGAVASARAQEEAARAGLAEAAVQAERAEREYARVVKLSDAGLATRQNLDEAKTARDAAFARVDSVKAQIKAVSSQVASAEAQVQAARAEGKAARAQAAAVSEEAGRYEIMLDKAVIKAPMAGLIAERLVNVGDMPGDGPVFKIVDNSVLNLVLTAPARDQAAIRPGQPVSFSTDSLPGEVFTGEVKRINPAANPADRSVAVLAEVANKGGNLKGGMFVKGRIVTGEAKGVFALPRTALVSWDMEGKKARVFKVKGDVAALAEVTTGRVEPERVEIVSGLAAGELIVVRGGFNLRDGDRVLRAQGAK